VFNYASIGNYAKSKITGNLTISVYGNTSMGSIDLGGTSDAPLGTIVLKGRDPGVQITIGNGADNAAAVISTGNEATTTPSGKHYVLSGTNAPTVADGTTIKGSADNKLAELTRSETDAAITGGTTDFEISSATAVALEDD
jgi:hypothetical protein